MTLSEIPAAPPAWQFRGLAVFALWRLVQTVAADILINPPPLPSIRRQSITRFFRRVHQNFVGSGGGKRQLLLLLLLLLLLRQVKMNIKKQIFCWLLLPPPPPGYDTPRYKWRFCGRYLIDVATFGKATTGCCLHTAESSLSLQHPTLCRPGRIDSSARWKILRGAVDKL